MATTFYRPDAKSEQVYTQEGKPVSFEEYKSLGGVGELGKGAFADVKYAPLPSLKPKSTTGAVEDPIGKFNLGILSLLTKAQSFDPSTLYNERNRLATGQIAQSMAPASELNIQNLDPNSALNARSNVANLYNPEINNLTDRIQAATQAVSAFRDTLAAAQAYGQDLAKYVKPDEQTIQATQDMLAAGINPGQDILQQVGKYIDWKAVTAAQKAEAKPVEVSPGASLIDPATGKLIYQAPFAPSSSSGSDTSGLSLLDQQRLVNLQNATTPAAGQIISTATGYPVDITDAAALKISDLQNLQSQTTYVAKLINQLSSTGALKGWTVQNGVYVPIVQDNLDPAQVEAMQEMQRLANLYIYATSGKQINEQEFQRLQRTVPSILATTENNQKVLENFKRVGDTALANYLKVNGWKINPTPVPVVPAQTQYQEQSRPSGFVGPLPSSYYSDTATGTTSSGLTYQILP